ncbi:hypothetical protein DPMN_070544 [Dreissena polymorpha]|uniref:Reverse transcriptase domain-containing protein n=1 Tax=Dreissena polymorpha TaxID=45954 RepID=A0A9D3Z163_DREPO|nr:hypothetical protein DPMN_070544 [Dreissena polymorpha]
MGIVVDIRESRQGKGHGCQTTLLELLEDWRQALDKDHYAAAIIMDLSKAFDCLPHYILLSKLSAYDVLYQRCPLFCTRYVLKALCFIIVRYPVPDMFCMPSVTASSDTMLKTLYQRCSCYSIFRYFVPEMFCKSSITASADTLYQRCFLLCTRYVLKASCYIIVRYPVPDMFYTLYQICSLSLVLQHLQIACTSAIFLH